MNIKLVRTCNACPEQYDAVDESESTVGYLRLRHGYFTVECPDVDGTLVYSAKPSGDGIFEPQEREYYLNQAIDAIKDFAEDKENAKK